MYATLWFRGSTPGSEDCLRVTIENETDLKLSLPSWSGEGRTRSGLATFQIERTYRSSSITLRTDEIIAYEFETSSRPKSVS